MEKVFFNTDGSSANETAIKIAKKHEMWVLSDLAYADIYFDTEPPPSILQLDGARDIAVEADWLRRSVQNLRLRLQTTGAGGPAHPAAFCPTF